MKTMTGTLLTALAILALPTVADAALIQYWTFDDGSGTTAANTVPAGSPGQLTNFALSGPPGDWVTTGLSPKLAHSTAALDFDGTNPNDYVDAGWIGHYTSSSANDATVSMWINPRSLTDRRLFGQLALNAGGTDHGATRIDSTGKLQVYPGAGPWQDLTPAGTIQTNQWQQVTLVWKRNQVTAYVDGVEQLTATSGFYFDGSPSANRQFGIGAKFLGAHGNGFDGLMDDVAVFNQALTGTQIGILAGGAAPSNLHFTAVNVDIQGGGGVQYQGPGAAPDDSGNTYWNVMDGVGGWSKTNLTASDGATQTAIGVALSGFTSTYDTGSPTNALQKDRIYATSPAVGNFDITGLDPNWTYDIYLYGSQYGTSFTIGSETKTATGANAGNPALWSDGFSYVVFEGLTGGSSISGTVSGSSWAALAGIQVVQYVPEPSSAVLFAIGLVGLAGFGRRRRKMSGANLR